MEKLVLSMSNGGEGMNRLLLKAILILCFLFCPLSYQRAHAQISDTQLYPVTNFAIVTASQGYDNAVTSITLATGDGSKLPSTFPFYLVWWDATIYGSPDLDPNVEIIQVTNRSGDVLTIVRGQDGTNASAHNSSTSIYKLYLAFVKAYYERIESAIASAIISARDTVTLDIGFDNGPKIDGASESKPVQIGISDTECLEAFYHSADGPTIEPCVAMNRKLKISPGKTGAFYDVANEVDMLTFKPSGSSQNDKYRFDAIHQPLLTVFVPLRPSGDCAVAEESIVANDPLAEWITCADTTGDAVAFDLPVVTRIAEDTSWTITMIAVNKNASPTGTFTLQCAAKAIRPGTDAYAAHDTTNQQSVSFTTFDTQSRPESASATFTLNGTLAAGAHVKGQCNVSAAPGQIADIRLSGTALLQISANSLSD